MKKLLTVLFFILLALLYKYHIKKTVAAEESDKYMNSMGFVAKEGISGEEKLTKFTEISEIPVTVSKVIIKEDDLLVMHYKEDFPYIAVYHYKAKSDVVYETRFFVSEGNITWVVGNYLLTIDNFVLNIKEATLVKLENYSLR